MDKIGGNICKEPLREYEKAHARGWEFYHSIHPYGPWPGEAALTFERKGQASVSREVPDRVAELRNLVTDLQNRLNQHIDKKPRRKYQAIKE